MSGSFSKRVTVFHLRGHWLTVVPAKARPPAEVMRMKCSFGVLLLAWVTYSTRSAVTKALGCRVFYWFFHRRPNSTRVTVSIVRWTLCSSLFGVAVCFCEATQHMTQFQLEEEELCLRQLLPHLDPKMMLVLTWHPTGWCWWALARQCASATKSRHGSTECIFQKYVLGCGTCKQGCREKVWSSHWVKEYNQKKQM